MMNNDATHLHIDMPSTYQTTAMSPRSQHATKGWYPIASVVAVLTLGCLALAWSQGVQPSASLRDIASVGVPISTPHMTNKQQAPRVPLVKSLDPSTLQPTQRAGAVPHTGTHWSAPATEGQSVDSIPGAQPMPVHAAYETSSAPSHGFAALLCGLLSVGLGLAAYLTRTHRTPAYAMLQTHGHGHGMGKQDLNSEKNKGFVKEMRTVAMRMHTREQAPKEGKADADKARPMSEWKPTRETYLQFLAESKAVYDTMEALMASNTHPSYAAFTGTGLERSEPLAKDIAWFKEEYGLEPSPLSKDGPGLSYATLLTDLAETNPPAFICHWYNTYFAHTAGGRMIGRKVSEMCLDEKELNFYQYNSDLDGLLEAVRESINSTAEEWTPEQKEVCLEETTKCFAQAGTVLATISA